jgi:hypothetical protein
MLVTDEIVNFQGLHGFVSRTRLRIYVDQENHIVVFMVTELTDNPGTSVTNAWGDPVDLAKQLLRFLPENVLVDPAHIVWIEHYPEYPESYDRVYMSWNGTRYAMAKNVHPWQRIKDEEFHTYFGV